MPPRVLIVDDSVVARAVLSRLIDASDRFMVAGAVGSVAAALDFLGRARVDILLLDVNMPGVDGLTALPQLIAAGRGARIVVVSSSVGDGAAATVQALAMGAADTLVKPDTAALTSAFGRTLLDRLDRLIDRSPAGTGIVMEPAAPPSRKSVAPPPSLPATVAADRSFDLVAIGASTGGIHALGQLLGRLPATFRAPVLVTQHLPAAFMPYFAAQLATISGRPCDVAEDRMRIRPGRLIVAPGDAHLRCVALGERGGDRGAAVKLSTAPAVSGCLPSVDPMLASLAAIYGERLLAIVLSGMGRDGAEGAGHVRAAGGRVIVQDQASSVVWGMPGAVVAADCADAVLTPAAIRTLLVGGEAR